MVRTENSILLQTRWHRFDHASDASQLDSSAASPRWFSSSTWSSSSRRRREQRGGDGQRAFNIQTRCAVTVRRPLTAVRVTQTSRFFLAAKTLQEERLFKMLMKDYRSTLRPLQQVEVRVGVVLNQIIAMIEKEQIIVLHVFVDQKWRDSRLEWSPEDFSNISSIRLPSASIWVPDTFLQHTADDNGFLLPVQLGNVIIRYDGSVYWPNPMARLRLRCRIRIAYFPFDKQKCDLSFASWSYTRHYINYTLESDTPDLSMYVENNEWSLLSLIPFRQEVSYNNWFESDPFVEIHYEISIARKPLHVLFNTVFPCLMLSSLTLVSFGIPFQQEMHIGISILLAYSVFTLRLAEDVPSQSETVPLISIYLSMAMSFTLCSMLWFSIMNNMREKKRVPSICWRKVPQLVQPTDLPPKCCDEQLRLFAEGDPPSSAVKVECYIDGSGCSSKHGQVQSRLHGDAPSSSSLRRESHKFKNYELQLEPFEDAARRMNRIVFFIFLTVIITCNVVMWGIIPALQGVKLFSLKE